jgi:hypothetical protein
MSRLSAVAEIPDGACVCIWADRAGAQQVAQALRDVGDKPTEVPLSDPPFDGRGAPLHRLLIRSTDGPVNVTALDSELSFSGAPESLEFLASTFDWHAEHEAETRGGHSHVEYWGPPHPHPWLSPASAPMVIENWLPSRKR